MTTRATIINHGPKRMKLSGELLAVPIILAPGSFHDGWFHEEVGIDVIDDDGNVTPNLAGGHGEEGP